MTGVRGGVGGWAQTPGLCRMRAPGGSSWPGAACITQRLSAEPGDKTCVCYPGKRRARGPRWLRGATETDPRLPEELSRSPRPSAHLPPASAVRCRGAGVAGEPTLHPRRRCSPGSLASFHADAGQRSGSARSETLKCERAARTRGQMFWNEVVLTAAAQLRESTRRL